MSFRYKTIIGIAIIEAILLGILIWNALIYLKSSNENELIKRGTVTAELLATIVKDAVISFRQRFLDMRYCFSEEDMEKRFQELFQLT